jgi:uncharacterized protein (TIGR01777 family)
MKILITGGTGFIGSKLSDNLLKQNHDLTILSRKNIAAKPKVNFIKNLDEAEFDYDVVINLCGESIAQRWNKKARERIYHSRIQTTKDLVKKINSCKNPPHSFISASAIGYYGTSFNQIFHEDSKPTKQKLFSQNLCQTWEEEAKKAETRVVIIRTAVVLGKNGGMLEKVLLPFKLGVGGKIASGNQPFSWIHLDDEIGAINYLIENRNLKGAFNLSAPATSNNLEFSQILSQLLKRPCIFTTPAFVMRLIYGKMADELLIEGQKVFPKKLLESGYKFQFSDVKSALKNILEK